MSKTAALKNIDLALKKHRFKNLRIILNEEGISINNWPSYWILYRVQREKKKSKKPHVLTEGV